MATKKHEHDRGVKGRILGMNFQFVSQESWNVLNLWDISVGVNLA